MVQKAECYSDIRKYCEREISQLPQNTVLSDLDALNCLQNAAYHEDTDLEPPCGQLVWQYKVNFIFLLDYFNIIFRLI